MSQIVREKWEKLFQTIGVPIERLYEMSEEEFRTSCNFIRESGLDCPDDEPIPPENSRKPGRTISGQIRAQQNEEYERMQCEMLKKEEAREEKEAIKRREEEEAKSRQLQSKADKIQAAKDLGPEPANGVQICIVMPSSKRIIRKFDPTHLCDELFTYVTGQEEMFEDNDPIPFSLLVLNTVLEKGKTFSQAGIKGKTMVNVITNEDEDEEEED